MAPILLLLLAAVWTAQVRSQSRTAARINFAPLTLKQCKSGEEVCVELKYCPRIAQHVYFSHNQKEALSLMESYSCGLREDLLQVCCPAYQASLSSGVQPSFLVSGHKNLRLVNQKGCGISTLMNRISGGNEASVGEFPWMAILIYKYAWNRIAHYHCGGSLISDRFVLTAAHCLVPKKGSHLNLVRVRLGEFDISSHRDCGMSVFGARVCSSDAQEYDVRKITPHPGFDPDDTKAHHNDIGLVELKSPVAATSSIVPICLPVPFQKDFNTKNVTPRTPLTVAGWGMGDNGVRNFVLRKLTVSILNDRDCAHKLRAWGQKVQPSQICAVGMNGQNACSGDSGGPLAATVRVGFDDKRYQVGIVSYGYGDCGRNPVTLYTKVETFMRWILDNINQ